MNLLLLLVLFATPVTIGAGLGVWSWWKPRHDLDRLFVERARERRHPTAGPAVTDKAASPVPCPDCSFPLTRSHYCRSCDRSYIMPTTQDNTDCPS